MTITLKPVLQAMGLKTQPQQVAFVQLLHAAGTIGTVPGERDVMDSARAETLLNNLSFETSDQALSWLHEATQTSFLRPPGIERDETPEPLFARDNPEQAQALLAQTGITREHTPEHRHASHVLLLGAMEGACKDRFDTLEKIYNDGVRFDNLVLLGSERPLNPEHEPCSAQLPEAMRTEAGMLKHMIENERAHWPHELKEKVAMLVNTPPREDGGRANTADTLRYWLTTHPEAGNVIVISSGLQADYQKAACEASLPKDMKIEMASQGNKTGARVGIALDAFARQIDAGYRAVQNRARQIAAQQDALQTTEMVDLSTIKADSSRLQFRMDARSNERGTSDLPTQTEAYDAAKPLDTLLLWENREGQRFVVDGHHRVEKYQRWQQEGNTLPHVPAHIMKEAEGVSVEDARAIGAYVNFAEAQAQSQPVNLHDAAVVFHDVQYGAINNDILPPLEMNGEIKTSFLAASLSDKAFESVRNRDVSVEIGARVAESQKDPEKQALLMDKIRQLFKNESGEPTPQDEKMEHCGCWQKRFKEEASKAENNFSQGI